MKICFLLLTQLFVLNGMASAQTDVSCACPQLACDPCSVEKGISFYTEKCGPNNSQVRSCKKPSCHPRTEPTKECPVPPGGSGLRDPLVVGTVKTQDAADDRATPTVGKIKVIRGSVAIVDGFGRSKNISREDVVKESDVVKAGAETGAIINFEGGNRVHVHPNSEVHIKEYKDAKDSSSRKALLHLIRGKIRNQVQQKYNGKNSYYKVTTKAAVAGVRGTDFVMEYTEGERTQTLLETIKGEVDFTETKSHHSHTVGQGFMATVTDGVLDPMVKIPLERWKTLDVDSRVDVTRVGKGETAKAEVEICDKPKGFFNDCAWTCLNNPKKSKHCRVDIPGVKCVRTRCNANGQWAEATEMSATRAFQCSGQGINVQRCDY